ncbi:hypothetical protein AB0K80_33650 [Streptomyces sp. NPDC052682]|uniref:hypothetical protein n=1 Tax=Streptomyces sp. NPDC052682 TaxID=3154954 RepID=UPI003440493E
MPVVLVVLVVLVLVGVRHLGDVRRRSVTYSSTAAGLVDGGRGFRRRPAYRSAP